MQQARIGKPAKHVKAFIFNLSKLIDELNISKKIIVIFKLNINKSNSMQIHLQLFVEIFTLRWLNENSPIYLTVEDPIQRPSNNRPNMSNKILIEIMKHIGIPSKRRDDSY